MTRSRFNYLGITVLLLALFGGTSGCAVVETNRLADGRYQIWAYGLGNTKGRFVQEASARCGSRSVTVESLECGSICTVGRVTCN